MLSTKINEAESNVFVITCILERRRSSALMWDFLLCRGSFCDDDEGSLIEWFGDWLLGLVCFEGRGLPGLDGPGVDVALDVCDTDLVGVGSSSLSMADSGGEAWINMDSAMHSSKSTNSRSSLATRAY